MSDTKSTEFERIADEPVESLGDAAILDELPAVPDAFRVHDEASANWVVRHVTEARARAARRFGAVLAHPVHFEHLGVHEDVGGPLRVVRVRQDVRRDHLGVLQVVSVHLGEAGRHVRAAIGVSGLPRHALVELQMTVEL